jgi:hypothetical protein
MRNRLLWLAGVVLLIPSPSDGHDHTADFFFAWSYAHASHLWGPHVAAAKTLPDKRFSLVGDWALNDGARDENDSKRTVGAGIRYMFADGTEDEHVPFAQVLIECARSRVERVQVDYFAVALGGGYDWYWRGNDSPWGIRVAGDVVLNAGGVFPRVTGGLVIRKR